MAKISVMVFAAGLGTRMGALTRDRPKPLVEVSGKPLIDHALALVDEINTSYKNGLARNATKPRGSLGSNDR